ncbi:MAG: hypothetical protein ACK5PF_09650 [bacterium]
MSRWVPKEWRLRPLKGKYYGSIIDIGAGSVCVWQPVRLDYEASDREIADGWTPDYGFDHVESQESYEVARLIEAAPRMHQLIHEAVARYENSCNTDAGLFPVIADMKDLLKGLETRP